MIASLNIFRIFIHTFMMIDGFIVNDHFSFPRFGYKKTVYGHIESLKLKRFPKPFKNASWIERNQLYKPRRLHTSIVCNFKILTIIKWKKANFPLFIEQHLSTFTFSSFKH